MGVFRRLYTKFHKVQKNDEPYAASPPANVNNLYNCTLENTKKFSFSTSGLRVPCKVLSVHDGDTVTVAMEHAGEISAFTVRLAGIDTPEMHPPLEDKNREKIITMAKAAQSYLQESVGNHIVYMIVKGEDKYGRLLSEIYPTMEGTESVNNLMISKGYALPYDGGEKKVFTTI